MAELSSFKLSLLQNCVKAQMLGPILRVSHSVGLISGGGQRFAFLTTGMGDADACLGTWLSELLA